jgi:hypothetical protein
VTQANFGDQLLKTGPIGGRGTRLTLVTIDDDDLATRRWRYGSISARVVWAMTGQRPAMRSSPYPPAHVNDGSIVVVRSRRGPARTAAGPIHSQLFGTRFANG